MILGKFTKFIKLRSLCTFGVPKRSFVAGKNEDVLYDEILNKDSEYDELSEKFLNTGKNQNCFIIQPYVKWGAQKLQGITPNEQLEEAVALVNTLSSWSVQDSLLIPLESFDKKNLFGAGNLDKLKKAIRGDPNVNTVFINVGNLKKMQITNLEKEFHTPIVDRYKIVMQILKMHAISKHAKLQVALAELYYLQQKSSLNELNTLRIDKEKFKLVFQRREQKIKKAIEDLRTQRSLLRNKRQKIDFPVIAVVGYTNAGKTSLIRALTGDEALLPRNQLFATLDVTMHAGILPSGLKVLFVDTVGFISDIPTNLIECFVATLEDAVLADLVLQVGDLSSSCYDYKQKHVMDVLKNLATKTNSDDLFTKLINVGNKSDLETDMGDEGILKVSSVTGHGIEELRRVMENQILTLTNRKNMKIRVPTGGDEIRWLYKNATVVEEVPDEQDVEFVLAQVIISHANLQKFKHHFA